MSHLFHGVHKQHYCASLVSTGTIQYRWYTSIRFTRSCKGSRKVSWVTLKPDINSSIVNTHKVIYIMFVHTHCTHGTCGVLDCLLFCDQTRPNLRISLVGYHCAIEFPCGVPLFYCCKYPTTYGVRVHTLRTRISSLVWSGLVCWSVGYYITNTVPWPLPVTLLSHIDLECY